MPRWTLVNHLGSSSPARASPRSRSVRPERAEVPASRSTVVCRVRPPITTPASHRGRLARTLGPARGRTLFFNRQGQLGALFLFLDNPMSRPICLRNGASWSCTPPNPATPIQPLPSPCAALPPPITPYIQAEQLVTHSISFPSWVNAPSSLAVHI